nr:hypothetical protein [Tanacetum cinerariifolium]
MRNGFCSFCNSGNSYVYDPNPNSFDCPPDSYHPPHPTYETYSYDSYGNDFQFGYDCQPQFSLSFESEPGYNENYNSYPYDSSSSPQQYPCFTPSLSTEEPDNSLRPTVPNPPKPGNPEEDECVDETYKDPDHAEYNIKVPPPPPVQQPKP